MSQSHIFGLPEPPDRPLCSNCGWTMWIARIEPDNEDHDKHTFACSHCDYQETRIVKREINRLINWWRTKKQAQAAA